MHPLYFRLRNLFCGSVAIAVIACGRVRRAKQRALNSNVVTAIYFHNPNRKLFAKCVQWLAGNGYTFISVDDLMRILHHSAKPPKGAVWLSFDDGFKELLEAVVPVARQRRIPITLFIPSGIIEGDGLFPWLHHEKSTDTAGASAPGQQRMRDSISISELKEIASYPEVSIGSHTVGHTVTINLSDEEGRFEFGESKRVLESWSGRAVKSFAYPEGRFDGSETRFLAECGYQMAATTEATFVSRESDPYLVPRFHVGDNISFPEAICNMVGMWRPTIDPLIHIFGRWGNITERVRHPSGSQNRARRETSV